MPKQERSADYKGYAWIKDMPSQMLISFIKTFNLLEQILEGHFQKFGLSAAKFNALFLLSRARQGLLLSELGEHMLVTRANITGLIDRMEKEGLVKRISHPTDRRSIIARITAQGSRLIEQAIPSHQELNRNLLSVLSENEKTMAIQLLDKIYRGWLELGKQQLEMEG